MEIKTNQENVPLFLLKLDVDYQGIMCFEPDQYSMKKVDALTSDAVNLLLKVHPVLVIHKRRSYCIVSGCRTFQAASFCFPPTHEIPVSVLDKRTTKHQIELLRYMDQSVTPLFFRVDGSLADSYKSICSSPSKEQVWMPPYNASMHAFASLLSVSPSTLCKPSKSKEIASGA